MHTLTDPLTLVCPVCNKSFLQASTKSKFCSPGCRQHPSNRVCRKCGNQIPGYVRIDQKVCNLRNRRICLSCLPYKEKEISEKSPEEIKKINAEKQNKYYYKHREKLVSMIKDLRHKNKSLVVSLTDGCQFCQYNKTLRNIAFHHVDDSQKLFNVTGNIFQLKKEKWLPELKKCVITCHMCHGDIHDGLILYEEVVKANSFFLEKLLELECQLGTLES